MGRIKNILSELWGTYLYYKFKHLYEKNPTLAADALYYKIYKRHMNLDNPKNLIEKITWLSLNTDTSLWTLCADKYRMRSYVEEKGCGDYLPILYGHWDNPYDIDFDTLPNEFVLKANNGCGTVMIVRDKSQLDIRATQTTLKKWLKRPFGYWGAQKHYLSIKPCIIAEQLLKQDESEKEFSPHSIADYKVWCFKGKPECVWVAMNRKPRHLNMSLFDQDWEAMPQHLVSTSHYEYNKNIIVPRPNCLEKMLNIASIISEPFDEVRVDFYVVNNQPVIGELTFTTGYGYFTDKYYDYLGSKIDLPNFNTNI